jgi:hypothetical protein
MVINTDFVAINTSTERTVLALEGLEKLKSIIYIVESRYNILESDYTTMLDDAISRVQALKSELDKLSSVHSVDVINHTEASLIETESIKSPHPTNFVENEAAVKQQRSETVHRSGLQSAVDAIGDAIELGLDKIGDGITFPVVSLLKLVQTIQAHHSEKSR